MEASFARVQEAEHITLDEWWQIHQRVPSHTRTGEELSTSDLLSMIDLRHQGCTHDLDDMVRVPNGFHCQKCFRKA
jgi:hypothetical protein